MERGDRMRPGNLVEHKGGSNVNQAAIGDSFQFSLPLWHLLLMILIVCLVGAGAWLFQSNVRGIFLSNLWLNGAIITVFLVGVIACFWQLFALVGSVRWIGSFVKEQAGGLAPQVGKKEPFISRPPRLLAPLASWLRSNKNQNMISDISARSILESISLRIDETGDVIRYLVNLLVFLGLLGTFYGLASTVPAVVDTIRLLAQSSNQSGASLFSELLTGLEKQLGGMGTAFSSSLLGLAGSLVVGLLELFVSRGQNRFYRELEDWLSLSTRHGLAADDGENGLGFAGQLGVGSNSLQVDELNFTHENNVKLQKTIEHLGSLIAVMERQSQETEARFATLYEEITKGATLFANQLTAQAEVQSSALSRIAAGQERLGQALSAVGGDMLADSEARMTLRSIDLQLSRISEELNSGRQETLASLRSELSETVSALWYAVNKKADH